MADGLQAVFFSAPVVGMHFDRRAIKRNSFDFDRNGLLLLQLGKDPLQYAILGPTVHAHVYRKQVTKPFRQTSPFTHSSGGKASV